MKGNKSKFLIISLTLLVFSLSTTSQGDVFYRCVNSQGSVLFTNSISTDPDYKCTVANDSEELTHKKNEKDQIDEDAHRQQKKEEENNNAIKDERASQKSEMIPIEKKRIQEKTRENEGSNVSQWSNNERSQSKYSASGPLKEIPAIVLLLFIVFVAKIILVCVSYIIVMSKQWIRMKPSLKKCLGYEKLKHLEKLRREFNVPHKIFLIAVLASSQLGRNIIKSDYALIKKLYPHKSEKTILKDLLLDDFKKDPDLITNGPDDQEALMNMVDEAIKRINTLDQLCNYIEAMERQKQPDYYRSAIGKGIEQIIAET